MDYATANRRAAAPAQKQKAAAAPPKPRAVPARDAAQAGCRRSAAGQAPYRTAGHAAHAFLKCRFLPHHDGQDKAADPQQEADFFASLALLSDHYGIAPTDCRSLGYPYSRAVALWEVRRRLKTACEPSVEIRTKAKKGRLYLSAKETYCTGNTLYYIPVVPLHRLMRCRRTRKGAQLLLGVCAYLYHEAGVPYYRDEESYLFWEYGMIAEWVEDDPGGWEQEHYWQNRSQLHEAYHIGDVMHRRLCNGVNLESLGQRAAAFAPMDSFGCECLALAREALQLREDFKGAHLYRNADTKVLPDPEGYDGEDCITMDKYISFCADTKGWLYQTLSERVNNEFGECTAIQEPVLRRRFDGRRQDSKSLDFECRLFRLIEGLCSLLNQSDYEN